MRCPPERVLKGGRHGGIEHPLAGDRATIGEAAMTPPDENGVAWLCERSALMHAAAVRMAAAASSGNRSPGHFVATPLVAVLRTPVAAVALTGLDDAGAIGMTAFDLVFVAQALFGHVSLRNRCTQ